MLDTVARRHSCSWSCCGSVCRETQKGWEGTSEAAVWAVTEGLVMDGLRGEGVVGIDRVPCRPGAKRMGLTATRDKIKQNKRVSGGTRNDMIRTYGPSDVRPSASRYRRRLERLHIRCAKANARGPPCPRTVAGSRYRVAADDERLGEVGCPWRAL